MYVCMYECMYIGERYDMCGGTAHRSSSSQRQNYANKLLGIRSLERSLLPGSLRPHTLVA